MNGNGAFSVKTEKKEFVLQELKKISSMAKANGYEPVADDSVYSEVVGAFPASVMQYLYNNDKDTFNCLMSALDSKVYKVGEVNEHCEYFYDKNAYLPRFAILDSNYKKLLKDEGKWSDCLLSYKGRKYRFSKEYIGFTELKANNIRINDFAWYIYTVTNAMYVVVFEKLPYKSDSKSKQRYSQQLWKRTENVDVSCSNNCNYKSFSFEEQNVCFVQKKKSKKDWLTTVESKSSHAPKKNHIKEAMTKSRIGINGEEAVMAYERERLKKIGLTDKEIETSLIHRSKESDDYGFDIQSLDEKGKDVVYIEVKSTSKENGPIEIHVSENERRVAIKEKEHYRFYFVYDADSSSPIVMPYKNILIGDDAVELEPESYKATLVRSK